MQNESKMGKSFSGPLGVEVFRLMQMASGLTLESKGLRVSAKIPAMSTIAKRDYAIKVKRTPKGKEEAAVIFMAAARALDTRINSGDVADLEPLERPALIRALLAMPMPL